jgi:hypothetical protein
MDQRLGYPNATSASLPSAAKMIKLGLFLWQKSYKYWSAFMCFADSRQKNNLPLTYGEKHEKDEHVFIWQISYDDHRDLSVLGFFF